MTLLPPRPNHSAPAGGAQATSTAAPDETERDHVANALQMLSLADVIPLDVDALTRRLRLALASIDERLERERVARLRSWHDVGAAVDVVAAASFGAMLRIERVEIDARRLAAYGYARCANDRCLGGIVALGEPCQWCGAVATGERA